MLQCPVKVLSLVIILGYCSYSFATEIEVWGEGKDEQHALNRALQKAIEQVVGISIEHSFNAEQKEQVKNNQSQFQSFVRDTLLQDSKGYVRTYKIIKKKSEKNNHSLFIKADVYSDKISAQLMNLANLLKASGNPKVMIVMVENYIPKGKKAQPFKSAQLSRLIEEQLVKRSFQVVNDTEINKQYTVDSTVFDQWYNGHVESLRAHTSADILIAGMLTMKEKDDEVIIEALKDQVRIEAQANLKAVEISSGDVLVSKGISMRSMGLNAERAYYRMTRGKGNNLVKRIVDAIVLQASQVFKARVKDGFAYEITLRNVTKYRKQGRKWFAMLENLPLVTMVKELGYKDNCLTVELKFKGQLRDLEASIFKALDDSGSELAAIDKIESSPRGIVFSM